MPIFSEIVHLGVTASERSKTDPAIRLSQAVYPELFSPIETGVYYYEGETVVCLSSQIGCALGCSFCDSTGPFNFPFELFPRRFQRNLNAAEMFIQALYGWETAISNGFPSEPLLFSFMGMGEPLNNYNEVQLAIRMLGEMFPKSRVTISTLCPDPKTVQVLADDIVGGKFPILVKLHLSLHAPNDQLRQKLMPAATPLSDTIAAMRYFSEKTGLSVKANYVLMKGINDWPEHEEELIALLSNTGIILKVSDLNSPDLSLVVPSQEADAFASRIASKGIPTCRFRNLGQDTKARCGELVIYQTRNFESKRS